MASFTESAEFQEAVQQPVEAIAAKLLERPEKFAITTSVVKAVAEEATTRNIVADAWDCVGGCAGTVTGWFGGNRRAVAIAGSAENTIYESSSKNAAQLARDTFRNIGYPSSYYYAPSRTRSVMILSQSPAIFSFIGHGNTNGPVLSNGAFLVDAQVAGGDMPEKIYIEDYDLSNAKLHLYITCYAAKGAANISLSARARGVKCVIGWNSLFHIPDSFIWNERFMGRLGQGYTIAQARSFANNYTGYAYPDRTIDNVLYGDGSQVLKLN